MSNFAETSIKAAASFLHTVVIVDNQARFGPTDDSESIATGLVTPDDFVTGETNESASVALPKTAIITDGPLDAQKITRSFACKKLACAILRPSPDDTMQEAVLNAAQRSDILVLDWQMFDSGELAISIVNDLLEADGPEGRLRLITVYTSQSPLSDIAACLAAKVPGLTQVNQLPILTKGSARIILLSKGKSANAPQEDAFAVDEDGLSQRLIEEFAKFAQGLLSNATMASIAGFRDHTHRMLARFDSSMDGPLLTHRTLLPTASDAEEFAADMIMAELDAQVPVRRIIGEFLGEPQIKEYIQYRVKEGLKPAIAVNGGDTPKLYELDVKKTCALIKDGFSAIEGDVAEMNKIAKQDEAKFKKAMKTEFHNRLYRLLNSDIHESKRQHSEFAVRSKIRRAETATGGNVLPQLRLGTIVRRSDRHWVCLTPPCDSIRIPDEGGSFLFAELTETNSNFDLILPHDDHFRRVELQKKRTNLMSLSFLPDGNRNVVAVTVNKKPCFVPLSCNGRANRKAALQWIAELKPLHAQRLVQNYASNLARVGVDDFEWHRIQMPGGTTV